MNFNYSNTRLLPNKESYTERDTSPVFIDLANRTLKFSTQHRNYHIAITDFDSYDGCFRYLSDLFDEKDVIVTGEFKYKNTSDSSMYRGTICNIKFIKSPIVFFGYTRQILISTLEKYCIQLNFYLFYNHSLVKLNETAKSRYNRATINLQTDGDQAELADGFEPPRQNFPFSI